MKLSLSLSPAPTLLPQFAGLMVLVLILEFAAAITVAVMRPNIEELVQENMNRTMKHYGEPKYLVTKTWDDLQKKVSSTRWKGGRVYWSD